MYKCYTNVLCLLGLQTLNMCMLLIQCRYSVVAVGPTFYKCYTHILLDCQWLEGGMWAQWKEISDISETPEASDLFIWTT